MKSMKWVRSRRTGAVLAAGASGALVFLGVTAPAGAAESPSKIPVAQGVGVAALSNLTVFGDTPSDTPELVSFVLDVRNQATLQRDVEDGMPGGYLSVRQFAAEYGQTEANISALRSYLARYGITTTVYADDLNVSASGTAGEFDSALSVQQKQYRVPAVAAAHGQPGHPALTIHGTTQTPLLPSSLASFVLAVEGLENYPDYASDAVPAASQAPTNSSGSQQIDYLTPSFFSKHYGLDPLYAKGATGAGQTIGIVTLAALNPADPEYFWNSVLGIKTKPNRIAIDNVDGGPGAVSLDAGSDETTLDTEESGAIAPDANIVVYQAPNDDPGFTDAFYTAASQDLAGSVSVSWGLSETAIQYIINAGEEDPNYIQAFSDAFLELAAQGQSSFAATGDYGAYQAVSDVGSTNLSIGSPADSPWVTAAGGTTLAGTQDYSNPDNGDTWSITIPKERTWGWDYLWPYWEQFGYSTTELGWIDDTIGGSNGGFSVDEPTPAYQQGISGTNHYSAVEYLTPTDYTEVEGLYLPTSFNFNPTPSVTTGYATGRATPDVSTNADPQTGYEIYMSEFAAAGEADLEDYGGTSFVAPQLNGATAVIDSYLGRRVGFWNPSIYQFATLANSPFTPLDTTGTSNDNLYYTGTKGQIYNAGSGLGYPNLADLAADFARYGG